MDPENDLAPEPAWVVKRGGDLAKINFSRQTMIAKEVTYDGRVQGVGFRFTTKQIASGFEVSGWVKNLADGRVQMLAAGDEQEVDAFLEAVEKGPLGSNIKSADVEKTDPPENLSGFRIQG
jgi:acylphosphatase